MTCFIAWYLIGILSTLAITLYVRAEVTLGDIVMGIMSGLFGPTLLIMLIFMIYTDNKDKVIFPLKEVDITKEV